MKPCVCIGCDTNNLKTIYDVGIRHVEISFSGAVSLDRAAYHGLVTRVEDNGLSVAAANGFFPSSATLGTLFGEDYHRDAIRDYVKRAFENTSDIHFASIAFGSGFMRIIPDGFPREKAVERFMDIVVKDILPELEAHDAYLSFEELQASETNFLNSCCETAELVRRIDSKRVGLLCDFYHMSMAGETPDDVREFYDVIRHVHIASPTNNRSFPFLHDGDDEVYAAFFRALAGAPRFDGYVSIEGGIAEKDRPFETAIVRSMDMFKAYLPGFDA